jgi:hypothetical protein
MVFLDSPTDLGYRPMLVRVRSSGRRMAEETMVLIGRLVESHGWFIDLNDVTLCQPCQAMTFRQR